MRAPTRFHWILSRLFGRRTGQDSRAPQCVEADDDQKTTPQADPVPMFSLGENKQELVASYRNLERESA